VAGVDVDLGAVNFAEDSAHGFDFAALPWGLHELSSVSHGLSCIGIVFNSWYVAISCFVPEIACDEIMTRDVGPVKDNANPSVFGVWH
jgi:hypothetical protein